MSVIEPHAVTQREPLHRPAQVRFRQFQHQVKMILHEHITVQAKAIPAHKLFEQTQEMSSIASLRKMGRRSFPRLVT